MRNSVLSTTDKERRCCVGLDDVPGSGWNLLSVVVGTLIPVESGPRMHSEKRAGNRRRRRERMTKEQVTTKLKGAVR